MVLAETRTQPIVCPEKASTIELFKTKTLDSYTNRWLLFVSAPHWPGSQQDHDASIIERSNQSKTIQPHKKLISPHSIEKLLIAPKEVPHCYFAKG